MFSFPVYKSAAAPALWCISLLTAGAADGVRLDVSRDVWVSSFPAEQDGNNGGSGRLKAKGIQEMFLMDAEFSELAGKSVTRALLHVHLESPDAPLRRMTVGTVAVPWVEGQGNGYEKGTGGATFRSPGTGTWGEGPDITAAILGQAGTVWGFGEASAPDAGGWQEIPVLPAVVEACAAGRSHGVVVMDDVGSEYEREGDVIHWHLFPNRYIASHDGPRAKAPWFEVWTTDAEPGPVAAVPDQKAEAVRAAVLPAASPAGTGASALPAGWRVSGLFGEEQKSLTFSAARNESVCARISAGAGTCEVTLPPPFQATLRRVAKVEGSPDPLPALSAPETGELLLEIHVPHKVPAGRVEGRLTVNGTSAPIRLTVWNFDLPDKLSFVPEMNAYGLPGQERAWYRLAHENRTCLNVLRYNWRGQVADGCAPVPGKRWDWTAWDERFGPLLDGSAFAGLPRAGTPVDAFYLPLNENWPMEIERHFKGGYWADTAFDAAYWEEFSAASREFADHVRDRGWREPLFEFYLNNKVYFKADRGAWSACSAPWIFDEPVNTQDFFALREFGRRFNAAARPLAPNALFRCDISRPEWQRDLLDGVTGVEVLSGALRTYRPRILRRQAAWGTVPVLYGSAAPPGEVVQPAAWSLEAWCLGAEGVLPWQTIGTEKSWQKRDELAVFYPTPDGPVPSLRLKSFRWGQQLVEYLTIYGATAKVSRESLAAAVSEAVGLVAEFEKTSEADAGTSRYARVTPDALGAMRERLGRALDRLAPPARRQWRTLEPPVHGPETLPTVRLVDRSAAE